MFWPYNVAIGLKPDKTLSKVYSCFANTGSQLFFFFLHIMIVSQSKLKCYLQLRLFYRVNWNKRKCKKLRPFRFETVCFKITVLKLTFNIHGSVHRLWYHHTYRCDDTRGCVMQFWPANDEHLCSKHVEAWNKTYCETNFVHQVG